MSKKHLKETMKVEEDQKKLNESKIKDHAKAVKKALKRGDSKSVTYNRQHIRGHQKDLKQVNKDIKASEIHYKKVKALK